MFSLKVQSATEVAQVRGWSGYGICAIQTAGSIRGRLISMRSRATLRSVVAWLITASLPAELWKCSKAKGSPSGCLVTEFSC
jgi:hypothetical protein